VLDLVITHSNDFTFTDLEQVRLARIRSERTRARSTRKEEVAA
jgi:hypothetical protein